MSGRLDGRNDPEFLADEAAFAAAKASFDHVFAEAAIREALAGTIPLESLPGDLRVVVTRLKAGQTPDLSALATDARDLVALGRLLLALIL